MYNIVFPKWRGKTSHVGMVTILKLVHNAQSTQGASTCNSIHTLRWNNNIITLPTCDVSIRHFRKMSFMVGIRGFILLSIIYSSPQDGLDTCWGDSGPQSPAQNRNYFNTEIGKIASSPVKPWRRKERLNTCSWKEIRKSTAVDRNTITTTK